MPSPSPAPRPARSASHHRPLLVGHGDATAYPLATLGLAVLAAGTVTEYRVRMGASATVSELLAYAAIVLILLERVGQATRTEGPLGERALARDLLLGGLLAAWLLLRAFLFRLDRAPDVESAFSHVRDTCVPLAAVLLCRWRVRLDHRGRRTVARALVATGVVAGAAGVSQFVRGWPYLFDGIEIVRYKTLYAQKYWIAEVLHLKVENLARGFYYFSIAYACSLVVPTVVAFALAWGSRTWRGRIGWGGAFLVCYAGVYFSFSRSILGVVPFGCLLAARAVAGRLRPLTCAGAVVGYVLVALVGPLMHLRSVSESDLDTLNSRVGTLMALGRHLLRDPSVWLWGSTVQGWREWNVMAPHNWLAKTLLADGLPGALLRAGAWLSLFASLYPVRRRGQRVDPVVAGTWAGSFTLLFVIGETEPLSGIAIYLVVASGLALRAAAGDDVAADEPQQPKERSSQLPVARSP